jgi:hypothetical protein
VAMPQFTQLPLSEQEVWRPVVGWEGLYDVSSLGRVRRVAGTHQCPKGRVLRPWTPPNGYLYVRLSRPSGKVGAAVHQLVATTFLGPCPVGMEVNHKDRDRKNVRADNLEYLTPLENQRHSWANGRVPTRGRSGARKLTAGDVSAIRSSPESSRALAARYGVTIGHIYQLRSGRWWRHVRGGDGG